MNILKSIKCEKSEALKGKKIALCLTGSVAVMRAPKIARELMRHGAEVITVMTKEAQRLIHPNMMEWSTGNPVITELTGQIEHVQLAGEHDEKVDLVLVCPSTANTIGKIAHGIDDTPVTTVVTTALGSNVPVMIVPAMHVTMYNHPIVLENIEKLKKIGIEFIGPSFGDHKAKMASEKEIINSIINKLNPVDKSFEGKKIVITAGGTIVPIDDVRHIGNFSSGKFLSEIANECIKRGAEVIYIHGKNAVLPEESNKLKLLPITTFEDYYDTLKRVLQEEEIDVIFLGMAVSDYGINKKEGKIKSDKEELILRLKKNPKIIKLVRDWSKNKHIFQIGFKLLSGVSEKELIQTAYKSDIENRSHLTIANDLKKIREGKRTVFIITQEGGAIKFEKPNIAAKVVDFVSKRVNVTHYKTKLMKSDIVKNYPNQLAEIKKACRELSEKGLMPPLFVGSKAYHGSIAIRVKDNSFLITARESNKRNITQDDIVFIKNVDEENKEIIAESTGKKPSFNTVISFKLFQKFKDINYVLHTHKVKKGIPITDFPYTPGTKEYAETILKLFEKSNVVALKEHGTIAIGKTLDEVMERIE